MIREIQRRRTARAVLAACAMVTLPSTLCFALPAFPGAEGYGATAVGGRGGEVFHVDSFGTNSTGTYGGVNGFNHGTLRWCLTTNVSTAPRTVVFDIGGQITLTSQITLENSKMTVAGQTAPGKGLTIAGRQVLVESSDDLIIRHIRARLGRNGGTADAMGAEGGNRIVFDHVTATWCGDENLSVSKVADNVTVQNCYMYEALNYGSHSYGSLIRPDIDSHVTYHHNLYADNISRNPRPGTYNSKTLEFDFINNVIYNARDRSGYSGGSSENQPEHVNMNYIGNYVIAGPSTASNANYAFITDVNADTHAYQAGNLIDPTLGPTPLLDGTNTGSAMFHVNAGSLEMVAAPFAHAAVTIDTAEVAYAKAVASGGAFPWNRDDSDARIANQVKTFTGAIINSQDDVGGFPTLPTVSRDATFDADHDGMADAWETARGFNPADAADRNNIAPNGYTNLENYLNYLTLQANWNVDASGNWSGILNWAGTLPNSTDATANFGTKITAPRTVTLDAPMTAGQINFDSPIGYTLAGPGAITLDVISGAAAISVSAGSHTISAPVTLADNLSVTVVPGSTLIFSGAVSATGKTISKSGGGSIQMENVSAAALNVNAGMVKISAKPQANSVAGFSQVQALAISAGAQLDLTNNSMQIDTGGSVAALLGTVRGHLATGRITSSSADPTHRLGYGPQASSVLIKFTYAGDSDLDGDADGVDIGNWATNFTGELGGGASATMTWSQGDWDYDGDVDGVDAGLWAMAFTGELGGGGLILHVDAPLSDAVAAALAKLGVTVVPEPGGLLVAASCSALAIAGRRQRRTP